MASAKTKPANLHKNQPAITHHNKEPLVDKKKFSYSFFAMMLLAIGSTVGVGIYYKTASLLENTGGNLIVTYLAWFISIVAIIAICLCMGFLNKRNKYPELSYIGYVRSENNEGLFRGCKNFVLWVLIPVYNTCFGYYCVQAIEESAKAFDSDFVMPFYANILIAFVIIIYFSTICVWPSLAEKHNRATSFLRAIPLLMCIIGGIIIFGVNFDHNNWTNHEAALDKLRRESNSLIHLTPFFGLIACFPAILFAFDGFYFAAGSFVRMKNPQKGPWAMAVGVIVVAVIYILVATAILLGSIPNQDSRAVGSYQDLVVGDQRWVIGIMALFIIFGMFGVTNGNILFGVETFRLMYKDRRFFTFNFANNKEFVLFNYIYNIIYFIPITIFGIFYFEATSYGSDPINNSIWNVADTLTNWCGTFSFLFLTIPIAGVLFNKSIKKNLRFKILGWISVGFTSIVTLYLFVDVFYALSRILTKEYDDPKDRYQDIVSQVITIVLFFFFAGVSFTPTLLKSKRRSA